ncbi:MAG TPA: AIR synthase related protein, partial [Spirochaetia bacterium]|nr:AIR synthase related protein [Spirochaetia bacterium]
MRLEVFTRTCYPDGRARRILPLLRRAVSPAILDVAIVDVYLLSGIPGLTPAMAADVFQDAVAQEILTDQYAAEKAFKGSWEHLVEVTVKPGVTDPVALTAREALQACLPGGVPPAAVIQTAVQYLVRLDSSVATDGEGERVQGRTSASPGSVEPELLALFFYNPLIQSAACMRQEDWARGMRPAAIYPYTVPASPARAQEIGLSGLGDEELTALSRTRLLALSLAEMRAVQRFFTDPQTGAARRARGLPAGATDVELEMIAQTWSEHCKHKIFNATIRCREEGGEETIHSLFRTFIKATTESIAKRRRFLRSVFHDNSGVIAFDRATLVCFKVETHNSPSALDPYGGAITGIVGVNRDIMGTGVGARPLFNTNVLCFGFPDT